MQDLYPAGTNVLSIKIKYRCHITIEAAGEIMNPGETMASLGGQVGWTRQ